MRKITLIDSKVNSPTEPNTVQQSPTDPNSAQQRPLQEANSS